MPPFSQAGTHRAALTVTAVNGTPVAEPQSVEFDFVVMPFKPTFQEVLEEYTGFWCGNCPRGFACLEHMNVEYGAGFVGISYHQADSYDPGLEAEYYDLTGRKALNPGHGVWIRVAGGKAAKVRL